jgi:hypothetical protein
MAENIAKILIAINGHDNYRVNNKIAAEGNKVRRNEKKNHQITECP